MLIILKELYGIRKRNFKIRELVSLNISKIEVPKMFNTLEEIAKRDREKAKVEGKLEGERELIIKILSQRFGEAFDKKLEEKIRKANEEIINQIKKNILSITLDELKEILK
jgi:transcription termination factor NusB